MPDEIAPKADAAQHLTAAPDTTLATKPESRWTYVERLKLCLEIIAILVAGWWAYTRFVEDQLPSLSQRADVSATLDWEKVTSTQCQAEYHVKFRNIGVTQLEVAETRLNVWHMSDPPTLAINKDAAYIDPMSLRQEPAAYSAKNDRLNSVYRPGESDDEGFSFVIRNTPKARMLFEVSIWSRDDLQKKVAEPTWHDFHWDVACGDQASVAASAPAQPQPASRQ